MPARYAKPTDEIGHSATVTLATGTADASHPLSNVTNFFPDEVFITSDAIGIDIVWHHASPLAAWMFSLHHHNIPAGVNVRFQRNTANAWGGALPIDLPVTIDTYPNTGLPLPVAIALPGSAFEYSRLHVPSSSLKTGIGSALIWGAMREDIVNVLYPATDSEQHPKRVMRTFSGRRREYVFGVRNRAHPASFRFTNKAQYAAFLALVRSCQDGSNAFLWWRDTTITDAMLACFPDDVINREWPANFVSDVQIMIEEIACGQAIPT